jgi:hypothetical protein
VLWVPLLILWLTWSGADASPDEGLLTLNTKDSTRFAQSHPVALSQAVSRALFPDGGENTPNGVVLAPANVWQAGVAAAPLVRWANGPLLLSDGGAGVEEELQRLRVGGLDSTKVIRVGLDTPPATKAASVPAGNPPQVAADVDELVQRLAGQAWPNIILVPDDPVYAIPAAYWAAQSGDVILFGGDPLPEATRRALERRGGQARIYLVGPNLGVEDLSQYGAVQRIVAWDGVDAAVALAEYRDESAKVGWGLDGNRYIATHNFVLANRDAPALAVAGLSLARFGKFGPLLWVERDGIPSATEQYLWRMKPEFFNTPAEGPFNHLWILGGPEQIGIKVQSQADLSQEIGAYRFEEAGLSGMETLGVVWLVAGWVSAVWLLLHSGRRLPQLSAMMRVSWVLLGLVLGPIAVWLYRRSYHGVPWKRHGHMIMWHRSGFGPALAASAMNRGFDGPLMLVISWLVTALGLPLIVFRGPGFWLGNSMLVGIFIAYFGALALHWLLMHAHMFMEHEHLPYGQAVRRAFLPAFFSMTAMAVGMMGFMWWIQMADLMMEGMPEDDEIMWWGTTLVSIVVGWLAALPVDAWLVRHGRQPGTM